jgi:hypothetical protein
MASQWAIGLQPQQLADACANVNSSDLPAARDAITATASDQGWSLEWLWSGPDQAEALALLRPR